MRFAVILMMLVLCPPAHAAGLKDAVVTLPEKNQIKKAQNLKLFVPKMSFKGLDGAVGDLYVPEMSFKGLSGAAGDLYVPAMSFKGLAGAVGDLYVPAMSFKGLEGAAGDLYVPDLSFKGKPETPMRTVTPAGGGLGALKPTLRTPAKPVTRSLPAARAPQPTREAPAARRPTPSRLPRAPEEPVENYKP